MSANVGKSLDEIIGEKKANRNRLAERRRRKQIKAKTTAPVGGVQKPTKPTKPITKGVSSGLTGQPKSGKIVVSGLVSEAFEAWSCMLLMDRSQTM